MQCLRFFDQISHHGNKNENPVPIVQRNFVVGGKNAKSDHILREKYSHVTMLRQ
jgi:hypothetical protein